MNQTNPFIAKLLLPFFTLFGLVSIICIFFSKKIDALFLNHTIIMLGNSLFFILAVISVWLHKIASNSNNPNVMMRSIMLSTFLKMIITSIGILLYVKFMKASKSNGSIYVSMVLYLCYMYIEVKIALSMNKK